jgi:hypothetical protein
MSASTHAGFNGPGSAVGVGQRFTAVARFMPCFPASCDGVGLVCRFSFADARGVGQRPVAAIVPREGRTAAPEDAERFRLYGVALGVGNDEDPVTPVRGADGESGYAVPLSIVPARGQVPENVSEPEGTMPGDVLHDRISGSQLANGSGHVRPDMARVIAAFALAREGEGLAAVSANEDVGSLNVAPVDG